MTIRRYTLKDGSTRWRARVNVLDKQAKKEGFRTREEAEDWYAEKRKEMLASRDAGTLYEPGMTVKALSKRWLEFKQARLKASTITDYKKQLDQRILPAFGDRKIGTITPLELQSFLDSLPSARLANKTRVVLGSMFRQANAWGITDRTPTRPLQGRREKRGRVRFLTHEEAHKLLGELDGQYRLMAFIALSSGLRVGEMLALTYQDVQPGYIDVQRSWGRGVLDTPKTGRSRRRVAVPRVVFEEVERYRAGQEGPPDEDSLIFHRGGRPLENWNFRDRLKPAAKKAGVGHVRPHDLRHTYAAWCLSGGVNPKFVQDQLGHSTISVTMDLYGHLLDNVEDNFRIFFEGQIGRFSDGVIQDKEDKKAHDVADNVVKLAGRYPPK